MQDKTELTVTIGHTTHETMTFAVAGKDKKITMVVGGSPRSQTVDAKTYGQWLEKFRSLRKQGLALRDPNPLCAHTVKFREDGKESSVCYDRKPALDIEIADLWRKVRAKVAGL